MAIKLTKFEVVLIGMLLLLLVFTFMIEKKTTEACNNRMEAIDNYIDTQCSCTTATSGNPFEQGYDFQEILDDTQS